MVGFSGGEISAQELMVLMAIGNLGNDAYGVRIQEMVFNRTGTSLSFGSIYACLERLEKKGFVEGRDGLPIPERGGRRKRFFRVTGLGAEQRDSELAAIDGLRFSEGLLA